MLPSDERLLLGPGPSLISPRVMRALGAPMLSHLDPQFLAIMDDTRARLARVFKAPEGSFAFAVSGTGTSAMKTTVANPVREIDLLQTYNMEIGAGLGPLAGKIWRIGFMGTSSTPALVTLCLAALSDALGRS